MAPRVLEPGYDIIGDQWSWLRVTLDDVSWLSSGLIVTFASYMQTRVSYYDNATDILEPLQKLLTM